MPTRRQLLAGAAVAAGAAALPGTAYASSAPSSAGLFSLGVASGDPLPDGVILWTRLMGTLPARSIDVEWQVAHDERFRRIVRTGRASACPGLAHSVHVDVRGLTPGREYHYRFRALGKISPSGRTRTAPSPRDDCSRLRFGIVNCQDFQNGYWPAYLGLAAEDLDLVVHLGDYIYEYDPSSRFADRNHTTPATPGLDQLVTLDDYRARHAQYKTDPALQAAHAAFPWVVTWDDHETENNYAGLIDEIDDTGARLSPPAVFGESNTAGTLTGEDQERWLLAGLDHSPARWNVIAQQVMMSRIKFPNPAGGVPPLLANLDQWDGYAPQRTRLLTHLDTARVANPVILAGDIHSTWFSELRTDFDKPELAPVAVEFTATSVSSDFPIAFDAPLKALNPTLNPHVRYFDGSRRGYLRCTVTRGAWHTDVRTVETIAVRDTPVTTSASYAVEAGNSTLVSA